MATERKCIEAVNGIRHRERGESTHPVVDENPMIYSLLLGGTELHTARYSFTNKTCVWCWLRYIDDSCIWRVVAHTVGKSSIFCISKYIAEHTCSVDVLNHDHRQGSSWVIANLIKDKLTGTSCIYRTKHIKEDVRKQCGVNLSYLKAYHAQELAYAMLRDQPEDSYADLHAYDEALKIENTGTVFQVQTDVFGNFRYMFMAMGASIRGFKTTIRHVLMVDDTHLKGKYKGVLLLGVAMDENNQIYLVAFSIVDNESDASWKWFMQNLKDIIGELDDLVFISDRHVSITNTTTQMFLGAFHGICTYPLTNNIKSRFKNNTLTKLYQDAAAAYHESVFKYYWNQIVSVGTGSLAEYLQEIGVERWARYYQALFPFLLGRSLSDRKQTMSSDEATSPVVNQVSSMAENNLQDATDAAIREAHEEIQSLKRKLRTTRHELNNKKLRLQQTE
ncbi:uncharacterized protein LOC111013438 [Momordica charantia]|uniref:Uncharacterized protein LOC111013438 n=1 Tax=Momordica charantia TaxID=3673 RepID=A0A6J1CR12_MOMCH|nr:uncharacterized protein LOC111013438 [Momordica charantia]